MLFFVSSAEGGKHKDDIISGDVICLIPGLKKENVQLVIANENCNSHAPHAHVILDTRSKEGNVYAVNGTPKAITRLRSLKNKENVKIKGKISGDQTAWVIIVE